MKLAWVRPELRTLCQSADGLEQLCPQNAADARRLLTIVAGAETLLDLTLLQCLALSVEPPATAGSNPTVIARLVEVTLKGTLMNVLSSPGVVGQADRQWMRGVNAILVGDLSVRGGRHEMKATA